MAMVISGISEATTSWTTIAEATLYNAAADRLALTVSNSPNGQATSDFRVQIQLTNEDVEYVDYLSGTDFDSLANPNIMFASATGPHELPAGSDAIVVVRLEIAPYAVRVQAKTASGSAWVSALGAITLA